MIKDKQLKINGKIVKELRESIRLFNILEADKIYRLGILPTGRFKFEETIEDTRLCKVVGKNKIKKGKIQLNLHDGSNVLSEEKIDVLDSVELDFKGKIKKIIKFENGKKAIVISGRRVGLEGSIEEVKEGKANVKIAEEVIALDGNHVVVYG